ncbi:MAG: prolipoprotein diacylglyceryl transferase [Lentisphaeria bacterium]|nr:prolipoprotein diacylglyceryl transferase [Lentisphaeria bacterium]
MELYNLLASIQWDFSPSIITKPLDIRWYGVCFALGFILSYHCMKWVYKRENRPLDSLDHLLFCMMISVVIGARLGECLFYDPKFYLSNPIEILKIRNGGLSSHGATIGVIIGLWWHQRKFPQKPLLWLMDRLCFSCLLTAGLIRVGNFFNSEIIGMPTEVPWGVVFVRLGEASGRHPTQLYEAIAYFIIFTVMIWAYKKGQLIKIPGRLCGLGLIMIFSTRFVLEYTKDAAVLASYESPLFTTGQWLSIPMVILGFFLLIRKGLTKTQSEV